MRYFNYQKTGSRTEEDREIARLAAKSYKRHRSIEDRLSWLRGVTAFVRNLRLIMWFRMWP